MVTTKLSYRDPTTRHIVNPRIPALSHFEDRMYKLLTAMSGARVKKVWCIRKSKRYATILHGLREHDLFSDDIKISLWTEKVELPTGYDPLKE